MSKVACSTVGPSARWYHLNETTKSCLANVADVRRHRETKESPRDRHALKQPHLLPLPATPYEVAVVEYCIVDVEGFLAWRQNFYSVPWRRIGQALAVLLGGPFHK